MAVDAHGTANHTATPDTGTAGDPGAGGDRGVLTDTAVVCDLNEVVEPYAVLDDRVIDRAPIDTGVGANLDAITDDQRTELRDFLPALGTTRIAETARAEHGARLHLATGTDHHADRKSVGLGKRVSVRVAFSGPRYNNKKKKQ